MPEHERVGPFRLGRGEEVLQAVDLLGGDGEADHLLDHHVDGVAALPTHGSGAGEGVRVVLEDVGGAEDALDGASFDVELVVAEAVASVGARFSQVSSLYFLSWGGGQGKVDKERHIGKTESDFVKKQGVKWFKQNSDAPLLRRKIPIRHSPIPQIPAYQHVDAADHMPHHAIPHNYHLLEPTQDLADLLSREPAHVASPGHVGSVEADAAAPGHCLE